MSPRASKPRGIHAYVGLVCAGAVGAVVWGGLDGTFVADRLPFLAGIALLFAIAESYPLLFHLHGARQSFSLSEALLFPLLLGFSFGEVVWGVAAGVLLSVWRSRKDGPLKVSFNVAQIVCSAAVAAALWATIRTTGGFGLVNSLSLTASVGAYVVCNQFLVAGAIALSAGRSFAAAVTGSLRPLVTGIAFGAAIGLLFAAAYATAHWAVALFTLPFIALHLGFRATLKEADERARFERIFYGSKEGICLLDEGGTVRAWNPALETITGYKADEMVGRVWSDVLVARDPQQRRLTGMGIVGTESEVEVLTAQGPGRWVSVSATHMEDTQGAGWVVLMRDVTAERAVDEAKSDFIATVSHELRTPLTTLKGSLQLLDERIDEVDTQTASKMVGVARRGAERLERLVMNLLAVSQIEGGTISAMAEELDVAAAVRDAVDSTVGVTGEVRLDVRDALLARADRDLLRQALEHVLDNARKFGPPGLPIRIEAWQDNGWAHITVADRGPGVPKAEQERVFDRFVRLGNILTRETQGAGVGLFIAKRAIISMGGEIWIESEAGAGTTVHVRVPLARPQVVADGA